MFRDSWPKSHPLEPRTPVYHITWVPPPPPPGFNTWINFLAEELKCLIHWPYLQAVPTNIPESLKHKYKNLRRTVDCTEVFIERPRHLHLQAQTWSEYNHHNTVKFLVVIAPNGSISYLSDMWGGRATDVHNTGVWLLELIDPGDIILADRRSM